MIRATIIASALAVAGLYTYASQGTFDAEAVQKAKAEKPKILTSAAYDGRKAVAGAQYWAITLPRRVVRSGVSSKVIDRQAIGAREARVTVSQAVIKPISSDTRKSVLRFAEINPQSVAVMLQSELKRVGCYAGPLNGEWNSLAENAVERFNRYARTNLSAGNPKGPAVVTVRQHQGKVCPSPCSFGSVRGVDGKCYNQNARSRSSVTRQAAIPVPVTTDGASAYKPDAVGRSPAVRKTWKPKRVKKRHVKSRRKARSRRAKRKRYRRYHRRRIFNEAFGYSY